jgi:sporulation protein YlmC with PRC-barrel domain
MPEPSIETAQNWQGRTMVDLAGDKLGTIDAIYLDDETGQPEWALVYTGLFTAKTAFVPLAQAQDMGNSVQVPYDQVTDAPTMKADGSLSQDDEAELYRHYGLDYSEHRSDSGLPAGTSDDTRDDTVGRDVSGPTSDQAMTAPRRSSRSGPRRASAAGRGYASTWSPRPST